MPRVTVIQLAKNLIYYCIRNGEFSPDSEDGPVLNVLNKIYERLQTAYNYDLAYHYLYTYLERYASEPESVIRALNIDQEAADMVSFIETGLTSMMADHCIIIPIRKASLSQNIKYGSYHFITGSRAEKITSLQKLTKMKKSLLGFLADHAERNKSPKIFYFPLLVIKRKQHTDHACHAAPYYALWGVCSILAIYHAYHSGETDFNSFLASNIEAADKCNHLAVYSREHWRCNHRPLDFSTVCPFEIDWLHEKKYKHMYVSLIERALLSNDDLSNRLFRAIRYFGKAIDEEGSRNRFDGLGTASLFLLIAAETLLLEWDNKQRERLALLLPRLVKVPGYTKEQCADAVDSFYRYRSGLVHAGVDVFPDYEPDFSSGERKRKFKLLKRMVAILICMAPGMFDRLQKKTGLSGSALKDRWLQRMRDIWNRSHGTT